MSMIRQRKKYLFLAMLAGICLSFIPSVCVIFSMDRKIKNLTDYITDFEAQEKEQREITAYVLKRDKKAGDVIEAADLKKIMLKIERNEKLKETSREELVGKSCRVDIRADTIPAMELLTDSANPAEDIRELYFSYIYFPVFPEIGDYVDIRISFPTGEDYIIASHKRVLKEKGKKNAENEETKFLLQVKQEEILRLSSSYVDSLLYEGTNIYAAPYIDGFQEEAAITYPVNQQVFELMGWDPNIYDRISFPKEENYRKTLEKNLEGYRKETVHMPNLISQKEEILEKEIEFFE